MKNVWVIIANSEDAYVYSTSDRKTEFDLVKKLTHVESKLKKADLTADRPGHYAKGYGNKIRGSYSGTADPKQLEMEYFAKKICTFLEKGRLNASYIGIIIIAAPHFYGLIKQSANKHLIKYIKYHIAKDYTVYQDKILQHTLKSDLSHKLKLIFIAQP